MKNNSAPDMAVDYEQASMVAVLARISSIVEKRNTIPILSNALIRAQGNRVEFIATDLDIEITDSIEAEDVTMPGEITVPAKTLHDIARKLKKGAVISTSLRDGRLSIKSGRSNFELPTLPSGDFPIMTSYDYDSDFTLASDGLKDLIDRTKFAISTEETRYYLNGIYLHVQDGKLRAVATDGHRLAYYEIDTPAGAESMPGVIVPRKAIAEIRRLLESYPADEDIQISISDSKIRVKIGHMQMVSKLIDGTFPDYERVIPRNNEKVMIVDGKVFTDAVDRVATINTEKSRSISMHIKDDLLTMASKSLDAAAESSEQMNVEYNHEEMTIGFNAKYVADTFAQIDARSAEFYLDGPASPALIKDPDNPNSMFVLMPLRV